MTPSRIVPDLGGDDGAVVEDEEDVHSAEFLEPAVLDGVEEDHLVAAVLERLLLGQQARGAVTARLRRAGAPGRGTDVVLRQPQRDWPEGAGEVVAGGAGDDDKAGRVAGTDAKGDLVGEDEGPQVQRGPLPVRHPNAVGLHQELAGLDEHVLRQLRQSHAPAGARHTCGVALGPKQCNAAARLPIGLQALKDLLRVVQNNGSGMQLERFDSLHACVVPAGIARPPQGHHVVRETRPKAGSARGPARICESTGVTVLCTSNSTASSSKWWSGGRHGAGPCRPARRTSSSTWLWATTTPRPRDGSAWTRRTP